ncbi:MAG: serine protein kinase RIO [Trueperaceae bacterium]|nr:serine protein kinase RIO [Trueperaceae bacterium]
MIRSLREERWSHGRRPCAFTPPSAGDTLKRIKRHVAHDDQEESFGQRKDRRRPRGRVRAANLTDAAGGVAEVAWLIERGFFTSVEGELKSGKEATVYLGHGPTGLVAVKVYREVRSFKNDARYREGRFVGDARTAKAIAKRTGFGKKAQAALWAAHEYHMLWRFRAAGIPVPEPLVGPERSEILKSGEVVLMRYIGDERGAAPRLADVALSETEARSAFQQSVHWLGEIWRAGFVHADYSTYNLLWWDGGVVVIDLPQAVDARHKEARELLARDADSLCTSFRTLGLDEDPARVVAQALGPKG